MIKSISSFILTLLTSVIVLMAQKSGVHQFNRSNGFENAFIYEIQQTPRGYITISSNYGFYVYDGSIFNAIKFSESNGNVRSLSHQVLNDDSIYIAIDESIILFNLRSNKVLKSWKVSDHVIKKLILDKEKNIWAINGNNEIFFIQKNNDKLVKFHKLEGELIYDLFVKNKNELYLSTSNGFMTLENNMLKPIEIDLKNELSLSYFNQTSILLQEKNSADFLIYNIVTHKIVQEKKYQASHKEVSIPYHLEENKSIVFNKKEGIFSIEYNQEKNILSEKLLIKSNEFISHDINNLFRDKENNYWLGSKGGGLYKIDFTPFLSKTIFQKNENAINSICAIDDYLALIGTNSGLKMVIVDKENFSISIENLGFNNPVQKIFKQSSGKIYFKSESEIFEFKDGNITPIDLGENWKLSSELNDIYETHNTIFLSTNDGIIAINKLDKTEIQYTTSDLLLHNSVFKILKNKQQELWVISPYTLPYCIYKEQAKKISPEIIKNLFFDPISLNMDKGENIWFGTKGDGLIKYNGKEIRKFNKENGLISNTVVNVLLNTKNKVWAVHESGISILQNEGDNTNILKTLAFPDEFDASQMQANAPCFGLNNGLFFHNQETIYYLNDTTADNSNKYLNLFVKEIKINNETFESNENIISLNHGYYRIEFQFQTIYLQKPSMVKYAYRLLGSEDTSWIEKKYTESELILPNLSDGTHIIQLKSFLSDDSQSSKIITYEIDIATAIYKKWWFWLLSLGIVTGIIFSFIQWRINRIKKDKVELEKIIGERTSELKNERDNLKSAKDIIEQKTNSITESIEYARKIQISSLPALDNLGDKSENILVFSRPKDIVSGDFYWFKRKDNCILLTVFDCTGHGVPAGFISMIGIKLISKIVNDGLFNDPAEILNRLNALLLDELSPETEIELYNTAMDAAIAFIDLDKMELTFAGAARPIIIASKGNTEIIKGNTLSIGGYNSKLKEPFTNIIHKLNTDDMIYLFSDGYADQFNGTTKKRYFNKQLFELLTSLRKHSIQDQQKKLNDNLDDWMSTANQTDDILILGFRV
jgi:serine phosphatase RsbU (regulator of sigma subunit)/ligand-binding sensor domain-containing protein